MENVTLLSSNQLAGNEDMLSSISDHNLSLDISININLDECNELDDSYDLGEKLPFDEEMEVELKEDEFSSAPQFSDSLSISTVPIAKKTTVSAGKQAAKRKLSRRVSKRKCLFYLFTLINRAYDSFYSIVGSCVQHDTYITRLATMIS